MIFFYLTIILALSICVDIVSSLTCLDTNGKPVEWFTSIKLPKIAGNVAWPEVETGAALVYQDASNPGSWKRASSLITDESSYIAYTIAPLYSGNPNITYVLYNDQPPPDRKGFLNKGHAKGLIIFNENAGIWLVHSVPGFPPQAAGGGKYSYPSSGHLYGQSFLCLSLSASQLDTVATQLYYNNVHVYDSNVPQSVLNLNPHLRLTLQRTRPPPAPYTSTVTLNTVNGTGFTSFAKDGRFRQDLYDQDVAPFLRTDLSVEAWRNGNGNIPSDCNGTYSVMNVNTIHFDVPTDLDRDVQYETNNDHSKWAVSTTVDNPWSCVGDINRQTGQFKRGGGTVCLKHVQVWKSYFDLISGVDPCNKPGAKQDSGSSQTKNSNKRKEKKKKLESVVRNIDSVSFEQRCRYMPDGTVRCQKVAASKFSIGINEIGL